VRSNDYVFTCTDWEAMHTWVAILAVSGRLKMTDLKITWSENAGPENDGQKKL